MFALIVPRRDPPSSTSRIEVDRIAVFALTVPRRDPPGGRHGRLATIRADVRDQTRVSDGRGGVRRRAWRLVARL